MRQLAVGVVATHVGLGLRLRRLGLGDLVVEFRRRQHGENVAGLYMIADVHKALFDIAIGAGVNIRRLIGQRRAGQGDVDGRRGGFHARDMDERRDVAIIGLGRLRRQSRGMILEIAPAEANREQDRETKTEIAPPPRAGLGEDAILGGRLERTPAAFEAGMSMPRRAHVLERVEGSSTSCFGKGAFSFIPVHPLQTRHAPACRHCRDAGRRKDKARSTAWSASRTAGRPSPHAPARRSAPRRRRPIAMGTMPTIIAAAVISTGRIRVCPGLDRRLDDVAPSSCLFRAKVTSRIELAEATPIAMIAPISEGTDRLGCW